MNMKLIALGKTGLQVSELCLGSLYFGTKIDEKTSFALLDQFTEAGGAFIDTANNYCFWLGDGGASESTIGKWLKQRGNRDKMIIGTKVGNNPIDMEKLQKNWSEGIQGLSKNVIKNAVELSLKRLCTDYIDVYYAHMDYRPVPLEETLEAFNELVDEGKVRILGCSNYQTWRIEQARQICKRNNWAMYTCLEQQYSYIRPNGGADLGIWLYAGKELLDYCKENPDVLLVAYSPLMRGVYNGGRQESELYQWEHFKGSDTDVRLETIRNKASSLGCTPNQLVLSWMRAHMPRVVPIISSSNTAQMEELLGTLNYNLSSEEVEILSSIRS
jgi:Predicted oxidoreductases (related to aryl-alcohol dehydrogenases)